MELSRIPAFGFETKNCEAYLAHCDVIKKNPKNRIWGLISIFGQKMDAPVGCHKFLVNAFKVASYIPGLSIIVGIGRLITFLKDNKGAYSKNHVFRAIVETCNLGFLFLIPDIIVTCARERKANGSPQINATFIPAPKLKDPSQKFAEQIDEFFKKANIHKKAKKPLANIAKGFAKVGDALAYTAKSAFNHTSVAASA